MDKGHSLCLTAVHFRLKRMLHKWSGAHNCPPPFVSLTAYLKDALYSTPTSKHKVAACVVLPIHYLHVLFGRCPQHDLLLLLSSFLFPPSIFLSLHCNSLIDSTAPSSSSHPALSVSSPFSPSSSLHHPCLSFRAEAAPVKLILLLC